MRDDLAFLRKNKFLGVSLEFFVVCLIFIAFSTLYSSLSVVRHDHFQSQANDFSIYDQALWLYSRFNLAFSTVNNILDLGDRFRPILMLISPIYWFTNDERVILIFQSVILSATVFPLWLIARIYLPTLLAVLVPLSFVSFVGTQSAIAYDFHEMSALPVLLAFLFYFLTKEKYKSFFVALILCLSVREHVGLLLWTLGFYIYFATKNLKLALFVFLFCLLWSLGAIYIVMPKLGQALYFSASSQDRSLGEAFFSYANNPAAAIVDFVTPTEKIKTFFWSLMSFGFLPIFYLPLIPTILSQFALRFFDLSHTIRWTIYYHYSLELGVLLAISTIFSLKYLIAKYRGQLTIYSLALILIIGCLLSNIVLAAPLKNLAKVDFWQEKNWMQDTRGILTLVPPAASVAAQNNLLPHLSHRKEAFVLPTTNDAEYIIVDLHEGQDNWNFYTLGLEGAKNLMVNLVKSGDYEFVTVSGDAYLLKSK